MSEGDITRKSIDERVVGQNLCDRGIIQGKSVGTSRVTGVLPGEQLFYLGITFDDDCGIQRETAVTISKAALREVIEEMQKHYDIMP